MQNSRVFALLNLFFLVGFCGCSGIMEVEELQQATQTRNVDLQSEQVTVMVSSVQKQQIRLGVDAERLWFWRSSNRNDLAMTAVGDLQADYVRVAINCAYEREFCVKKETAYKEILEMMTAMKAANPNISFFASPRPLHEAYTAQEKEELFGDIDNVPWSPYPLWIQQWKQNGTRTVNGKTIPRFEKAYFDLPALVQYYADYLNFMHTKGFSITYLDSSNEQTIITPQFNKYLYDKLPSKLNTGVHMPILVVPSTWSTQGGIDWLNAINYAKGEHLSFGIASTHNTGAGGSLTEFANLAQSLGKEPWNTELHGWTGIELNDEVLNSEVFWEHIRAGYSGIDTWLFFGPLGGRDHSMINSNGSVINTSGKYEIFKQVVNNSNRGYYIDITEPSANVRAAAFRKGNILSVWVLNKSTNGLSSVNFNLDGYINLNSNIEVKKWHKDLVKEGANSIISLATPQNFISNIDGESLYFFKLTINN